MPILGVSDSLIDAIQYAYTKCLWVSLVPYNMPIIGVSDSLIGAIQYAYTKCLWQSHWCNTICLY